MSSTAPLGVLALQGAFARHVSALERAGAEAIEVRTPAQLESCRALILPGGESTTILKLLDTFELREPLAKLVGDGMPVFGTCAGMILLAHEVADGPRNADGEREQSSFDAIDIDVRRNGYGRQINSFEADLDVAAIGPPALRAAFIRAPLVERVGPAVDVLATHDGIPVLCRQGHVLVSSFHPELTNDDRLHGWFLDELAGR
ncbi:MAG: pyridoxal 5'-phosphate synthase glutaminase subunit PdxT [Actinomycetota bacterium]